MKRIKSVLAVVIAFLFLFFACVPVDTENSSDLASEISSLPSEDSSHEHSSMMEESSDTTSSEEESSASDGSSQSGSSSGGTATSQGGTTTSKGTTASKGGTTASKGGTSSPGGNQSSGNSGGFTWDKGGNYTGSISVRQNQVSGTQVSGGGAVIDYGNSSQGYVMVKKGSSAKTKVRVDGPSGARYQRYILPAADTFYGIPLQMGNGTYKVSIWQQKSGNQYSKLTEVSFSASIGTAYYLYPNIYANYTSRSSAVRKGFGLCMNAKSDLDKVKSVYNYIITTISYDYAKASSVSASYVPNPDATLSSRKGICFDYACLMATMLRSQGIPTKIVFGYSNGSFHAWNQVYINGTGWIAVGIPSNGGWKRLDSTFGVSTAASYLENNANYSATEYY